MSGSRRLKAKPEHLLWVLILAVLFVGIVYALDAGQTPVVPAPQHLLAADLYPLYPGVAWLAEGPATTTGWDARGTFGLNGYEVRSATTTDIMNIASITTPFESYYRQKLLAAGWTVDNYMAAGGPMGNQTAYIKGAEYILIGYHTLFHTNVAGPNSPVACPCDTSLSIFSGSKTQ